ncbi:hypothetical protein E2C01_095928 [Portunus trituberculatus]|uniref:Uncharacterized protein n=1 Tax=Portunus trituberculatus TaxID=210409 RepID=A0A5B7K6X0_PORTR|nr:hypothetical protein [Portunus trituberculatus]
MVGFEPMRGRQLNPTLTTLSTTPPSPSPPPPPPPYSLLVFLIP